jgi:hypothetical protein
MKVNATSMLFGHMAQAASAARLNCTKNEEQCLSHVGSRQFPPHNT